jgi:hypothetical protein
MRRRCATATSVATAATAAALLLFRLDGYTHRKIGQADVWHWIRRSCTSAIPVQGALHVRAVRDDAPIADAPRPRMNHLRDGVDFFRVAAVRGDPIAPLNISLEFVVTPQAAAISPPKASAEHHETEDCCNLVASCDHFLLSPSP